jgi:hypothetical protein
MLTVIEKSNNVNAKSKLFIIRCALTDYEILTANGNYGKELR